MSGTSGTYTLEHLLPLDIVQPRIEVLDTVANRLELILVRALNLVGLADDEVEGQADAAVGAAGGEPAAAAGGGGWGEAQLVVARFGGGEVEFAGGRALLGENSVIVVENLL